MSPFIKLRLEDGTTFEVEDHGREDGSATCVLVLCHPEEKANTFHVGTSAAGLWVLAASLVAFAEELERSNPSGHSP